MTNPVPQQKRSTPVRSQPGMVDYGVWHDADRPGYAGRRAARLRRDLVRTYGPGNTRIVYLWEGQTISRDEALELYTEGYVQHLAQNPELLDWLVASASDVYDISPRDVESGTDYHVQKETATHLQDIAVRIAVERLGRQFEGSELIQIRGKRSRGAMLSPGIVPFHRPQSIQQPELRGWWKPGTIESFWQSNKLLQVRQWKSRIFVFGGSFNPIHNGHLELARHARDVWGFDRILFVPNGDNYRKRTLAGTPAQVRLEMVQAAVQNESQMEVLDVEVRDKRAIRTPITMRELSERFPDSQLALFRGIDSLHRTHRDCFLIPGLFVLAVDREGCDLTLENMLKKHRKLQPVTDRILHVGKAIDSDLSSTRVRASVAAGESLDAMVPPSVADAIRQRKLYIAAS